MKTQVWIISRRGDAGKLAGHGESLFNRIVERGGNYYCVVLRHVWPHGNQFKICTADVRFGKHSA